VTPRPLARRPPTQAYAQPLTRSWVEWDVTAIRNTLREHEEGIFYSSALLGDWMLRDDRVKSSLGTRVRAVQGLPFSLQPPKSAVDAADARMLVTAAEGVWPQVLPRKVLGEQLRWSALQGLSVSQILWDTSRGRWVPTLEWWHPQHLWYRWDIDRLVANTTSGPVVIEPGDGRWFVHAPHGVFRGWMHGGVRSLAFLVALRQYALRDWARASEMYGLGVRKGLIPDNCDPDDRDRFISQLANLASEGILLLPQGMPGQASFGFELEALASQFDGKLFDALGRRCDLGITLELLGQNLTSEVQEGSLAAARVHGDVRQDYLEADVSSIADDVREQLLVPWAWYNYACGEEDVPVPTWDVTPPEDKDASSKTMVQVGQGLTSLVQIGLGPAIDARAVLEKHGIPLKAGVEPRLSLPAPEQAPNLFSNPGGLSAGLRAALARLADHPEGERHAEGQGYADDVAGALRDKAAAALRPQVEQLLSVVRGARSYDQLRKRLSALADELDPSAFAELVEQAVLLAHLSGRHAVNEEGA
jgi:phage gp29-like protein